MLSKYDGFRRGKQSERCNYKIKLKGMLCVTHLFKG